jgi:hypothetical protein
MLAGPVCYVPAGTVSNTLDSASGSRRRARPVMQSVGGMRHVLMNAGLLVLSGARLADRVPAPGPL